MEEQAELTPASFGLEYMCEGRVLTEDVGSGIREQRALKLVKEDMGLGPGVQLVWRGV